MKHPRQTKSAAVCHPSHSLILRENPHSPLHTKTVCEILRSRADTPNTKDLKGAGSAIHSLRPLQTLRIGNSPKSHHYLKSRELWLNAMSRSPNLRSSTARSGQKRLLMFSNSSLRRQTKQSWPSGLVPAAHFTMSRVPCSGNGFTLIKMIFRLVRDGRGLSLHLSVPDQRVAGSLISSSELHSTKTITKRPKLYTDTLQVHLARELDISSLIQNPSRQGIQQT